MSETLLVANGLELGEGNTPLHSAEQLAEDVGVAELWVKDEGCNPTGSHKDRLCQQVAARARMLSRDVVVASSGNAGLSLSVYARANGVGCVVLTTASTSEPLVRRIESQGATVDVCTTSKARWERMRSMVRKRGLVPASNYLDPPVGSNPIGVQGFRPIAWEIVRDLGQRCPTVVIVPTMRGDLLWGLWAGFEEARRAGRVASSPRLVAVEPFPRIQRVLNGADYRAEFDGSTTQHSLGGRSVTWQAVAAVQESRGCAVVVGDEEAARAQHQLRGAGYRVEACSAAPLKAARVLRESGWLDESACVVLLATARAASEVEPGRRRAP